MVGRTCNVPQLKTDTWQPRAIHNLQRKVHYRHGGRGRRERCFFVFLPRVVRDEQQQRSEARVKIEEKAAEK
jgi:hypothetical protein